MATRQQLIELIRSRRAKQPKRRLRRPPRQAYPVSDERAYERELRAFAKVLQEATEELLIPRLPSLVSEAQSSQPSTTTRKDAWPDEADAIINDIEFYVSRRYSDEELKRLAARRGASVANFQKQALDRQLNAVIPIDLPMAEPWLAPRLEAFSQLNVSLIRSVESRYLSEIKNITYQGISSGLRVEEISDQISERYGVAESRAELIARDQVSKLNGQLNKERQSELGITQYSWSTSRDDRVRESHRDKEGRSYEWNDPPADTGHPGEDFQCRCSGIPLIESALGEQ